MCVCVCAGFQALRTGLMRNDCAWATCFFPLCCFPNIRVPVAERARFSSMHCKWSFFRPQEPFRNPNSLKLFVLDCLIQAVGFLVSTVWLRADLTEGKQRNRMEAFSDKEADKLPMFQSKETSAKCEWAEKNGNNGERWKLMLLD